MPKTPASADRIHRVGGTWDGSVDTVDIPPVEDADVMTFFRETTPTTPLSATE